jgi:hypothetical protein
VYVVLAGWSAVALAFMGSVALLVGGGILRGVLTRAGIFVHKGAMRIQIPLRRDVSVPVSAVTRVIRVAARPRSVSKQLYRSWYVMVSANGSTLALLAERSYRPDQLASFLALLPDPELHQEPQSLRSALRSHKLSAPISRRDVAVVVVSYLLVMGGVAAIFVALAFLRMR